MITETKKLRQISTPVVNFKDSDFLKVCDKIKSFVTNEKNGAVGLAAIQIDYPIRVITVKCKAQPGFRASVEVMVNPEIISDGNQTNTGLERCLSELLLGLVPVERYTSIAVKYQNTKGVSLKRVFTDYTARVVQHEIDHLNGILLLDKKENPNVK